MAACPLVFQSKRVTPMAHTHALGIVPVAQDEGGCDRKGEQTGRAKANGDKCRQHWLKVH